MSNRRPADARSQKRAVEAAETLPLTGQSDPARPPIWAEGRQAPAFEPMAFAEAGMLLAREASGAALLRLASQAKALAARLAAPDGPAGPGRMRAWLPAPARTSATLTGLAARAEAARRLLYGLAAGLPAQPPAPVAAGLRPAPRPAPAAIAATDPDLAAIRALLRSAPDQMRQTDRAVPPPAAKDAARRRFSLLSYARRGLDWAFVRVLAGATLAFATPVGYGMALYRHLDGVDLRETIADCHRIRVN